MNYNIIFSTLYGELRDKPRHILITGALLLASGCASIGHQFPSGQVPSIHIGETTQNDVYTMFGAPWRTGLDNGMKTWTYGDYHYNLFSENSAEDLVIKFDKHSIVSSFTYNTSKRSK